jgi:flagellar hook-associated protein 2
MAGTSYISGIISGLDMDSILTKLVELSRAPIDRLETKQAALETKLTAWQTANTRLLALKTQAASLSSAAAFNSYTVTSSDPNAATATAAGSAVAGIYAFTIEQLATAHQMASQGYADYDSTSLGSGTVTISGGGADPVVIDVQDLTLAQMRDAINNAGAGVRAHIINDGTATPYRLLLTSETMGADGAMTVAVNLSGGAAPAFTQVQAARDAQIKIGEGLDAIAINNSTNTIADAIPGVTLQLHAADPAHPLSLTVARDTEAITSAVNGFVEQYNALMDFINQQFDYNADNDKTGTLFGEYALQQVQSDLRGLLSQVLQGADSPYTLLSQVGLTTDADDKLQIDSSKLQQALSSNPEAVMRLFARYGESSDAHVSFVNATADTKTSGAAGYAVEITQAATRSRLTAGAAQTAALAGDETLTINGIAIQLTAGMTQQQVLDAINAHTADTGVAALATSADGTGTGNYLTLRRAASGSATITVVSTASNAGGDASGIGNVQVTESAAAGESGTGTGEAGLDVAGTIGGQAAEGSGQILRATAGDPKGLSIMVTATAPGSYGTIAFSQGVAATLDARLAYLTGSDYSPIKTARTAAQDQIDDIKDEITRMEDLVSRQQERIRQQFQVMEEMLGKLQTQSTYLANQFTQIANNWRGASG